jgi:hypothetical protein
VTAARKTLVIKVPKTPPSAYDASRPPSSLLLRQIEHLEWAVLPASQRKPGMLPKRRVKTEGQAAARIAQLTRMVLAAQAAPPAAERGAPFPPVVLPPLPPAAKARRPAPRKTRGPAKKARRAAPGRGKMAARRRGARGR